MHEFYSIHLQWEDIMGKTREGIWHVNNKLFQTTNKAELKQEVAKIRDDPRGYTYISITPVIIKEVK